MKSFLGEPIIAYSIESAKASGVFDDIVVSTDDSSIAEIARSYGASVPFQRRAALADDFSGTTEVVANAIEELESLGKRFKYVACIYATAPFLDSDTIRRGLWILRRDDVDYAVTVTAFEFPVQRALSISADDRVEMIAPEFRRTRSQDLPARFHDAGQLYWGTKAAFSEGRPLFTGGRTVPIVLSRGQAQDIDTEEDWAIAEAMVRFRRKAGGGEGC